MWSRKELKARAKEVLNLNYWKAVLVALICSFISGSGGGGGGSSSSSASSSSSGSFTNMSSEELAIILTTIYAILIFFLIILAISLVLSILVFNPLYVGCQRFFIRCGEGTAEINDIIYVFSHSYFNVVKIMFFRSLHTFLWSLLFFIPSIIKSYEYRMIPYLLAEDPSLSKEDAFRLTKEMMTGDKWNAFVLDWSFFGWIILSVITCCILFVFYVSPYQYLTNAELYHALKAKISGTPFAGNSQQAFASSEATNPYL